MRWSLLLIFFLLANESWAYPEFIGYGYTSCLTCHNNGAGGGPLSDYGRSLFALEIAANTFSKKSPEQLAESSGFFGSLKPLPWLKPYLKYRQIGVSGNIQSSQKTWRNIVMQSSFGISSQFGKNYLTNFEIGYVPTPASANPGDPNQNRNLISREYYLRIKRPDGLFVYTGFMDKPFGIRHPDHTAVNRSRIGLGQNDQSHGVMLQQVKVDREIFLFLFAGNLQQESSLRQKGFSGYIEFEPREKFRYGFSALYSQNDFLKNYRLANHYKFGFKKGNSILIETGLYRDQAVAYSDNKDGLYAIAMGNIRLAQGWNLTSQGEYIKDRLTSTNPETLKWGIGLLYFPMQRVEFRTSIVQTRIISPERVDGDTLSWQGQLHLSL